MNLNLLNNPDLSHFSQQLDLPLILEKIKQHLHFEEAQNILFQGIPFKTRSAIEHDYNTLEYLIKKIDDGQYHVLKSPLMNLSPSGDYESTILRLSKQSILDLKELNQLILHFESLKELHSIIQELGLIPDTLFASFAGLEKIGRKFRSFVSADGTLDYLRHPELATKYKKLQELESSIRNSIRQLMHSSPYDKALRYDEYDLINDHFVIPIRSDSYQASLGAIVAHSDSGMTLYVEPFSIRDIANQRLTLLAEIEEIIFSLCREFTQGLVEHAPFFAEVRRFYYAFDLLLAKSFYSHSKHFVRPQLSLEKEIHIENVYHPLLPNPVKNDIHLESNEKGIIISGPNTGGKTVTLKTIALCEIFLHLGLFLPADSAKIYPYEGVYFFGNDEQDLSEGLSSFAAETKNYLLLLKEITSNAIIFIDEIFNSTSSEEASALAMGLFVEIHQISDAKVLVSTHHQMLKTHMQQKSEYRSCHVGHDPKTHSPTYRIIDGLPGSSMALTIFSQLARHLYPTQKITELAATVLDSKHQTYEKLLQDVSLKQSKLDKLLESNRQLNHELNNKNKAMEGVLKLKLQQKLDYYENKFLRLLKNTDKLIVQLKKQEIPSKTFVRELSEIKHQFGQQKDEIAPSSQSNNRDLAHVGGRPRAIEIGKSYYATTLGTVVVIRDLDVKKELALVNKGAFTIKIPFHTLRETTDKKYRTPSVVVSANALSDENQDYELEIDCRGMRLGEFESLTEQKLDQVLRGEQAFVVIVHGHGDGILKQWLRTYLSKHDEFDWGSVDEFNDGATKISLKKTN